MRRTLVLALLAACTACAASAAQAQWQQPTTWAALFADAGVDGTIVVVDRRSAARYVHNPQRAVKRYIPASTFKIPHTLFALDALAELDADSDFRWDGVERSFVGWNRDHTLRSAYAHSAVWVYQALARRIGIERERAYLRRIGYGNADAGGGLERFWLDGNLRISAQEQVEFLQRLHDEALPFEVEDQRAVQAIMEAERGDGWVLRAKTGWGFDFDPQIGWYVGWVERTDGPSNGPIFFALNIDMPGGAQDISKRTAIARAVLASIGALPPSAQ